MGVRAEVFIAEKGISRAALDVAEQHIGCHAQHPAGGKLPVAARLETAYGTRAGADLHVAPRRGKVIGPTGVREARVNPTGAGLRAEVAARPIGGSRRGSACPTRENKACSA